MHHAGNARYVGFVLFAMSSTLFLSQLAQSEQQYPPADRLPISESIHGTHVADPYRWMETTGSAEIERWLEAQSLLTANFIAGQRFEETRRRIEQLASYDLAFAAKRRSGKLFYMQRPVGGERVDIRIREAEGVSVLLRPDEVPEREFEHVYLGGRNFVPSHWPDRAGNMLVYGYTDGESAVRYRVLDTESGLHLPDVIEELSIAASIEWSATGDGFYYFRSRLVRSAGATESKTEPAGLYFHRLGTSQDDDVAIIEQAGGDRHVYRPYVTAKGDYLVVAKREGTAPETSYLVFDRGDPNAAPLSLFADAASRFIFLGNDKSRLYFQTNLDAPNGRVIAVDVYAPARIIEVVPEIELPMLGGSNVGGDVLGYFGGHFVLGYLRDGLSDIRIFDSKGSFRTRLQLPQGSSIWGTLDSVPGESRVTASLLNPFAPGHVISFDAVDGSIRDELTADVPVDAGNFVVRRVFYESKDGARIPMSVVHGKDIKLDGSNPALVYGYGMHKWVSLLFYQAHIVHWLELGGIYAMPAIRGGGEYGDRWHSEGIKTNRQNAVDDFVAAGRWLIESGYTSRDRLAANGGSASGALAGIVSLRHGAVFGATTVDYPIADLVRAPQYGSGALLVEEYGSLDDPAEGRALILQSPYHQVKSDSCLMPTLIMVGDNDKVALPFHGYKLAAALQHAQNCDNPVLLNLMRDTGHNYGVSAAKFAENTAVQIEFLRKALNFRPLR